VELSRLGTARSRGIQSTVAATGTPTLPTKSAAPPTRARLPIENPRLGVGHTTHSWPPKQCNRRGPTPAAPTRSGPQKVRAVPSCRRVSPRVNAPFVAGRNTCRRLDLHPPSGLLIRGFRVRVPGGVPLRRLGARAASYTAAVPAPASRRRDRRERWFGEEARTRLRLAARRHWLFLVVLGFGLALRVVAQVAYRPSLLYIDSYTYLGNLHDLNPSKTSQPIGYELLLLRPVLSVANLAVVAALQHVIGLAMGVAIYVLALRLGERRWVAVLAAVPVLLDAYQLQIEQNIMSETLFEALILAAVVLLLWKRPLTFPVLAIGGGLLGLSATVRAVGVALVVPAVVFALVAGSGGWQRLRRAA